MYSARILSDIRKGFERLQNYLVQGMAIPVSYLDQLLVLFVVKVALEKVDRVDLISLEQYFVVKVRRRRDSCVTYIPDYFTAFHSLTLFHIEFTQMRIPCFIIEAVIDIDHVAI